MTARGLSGVPAVDALLAWYCDAARAAFGARLLGAYAIGSLAHGGFTPAVSDVDLALLADPLARGDARRVAALARRAAAAHPDYGPRLSVFWSSPAEFNHPDRAEVGGRFPALDRLDLVRHGRLLAGVDARDRLRPPSRAAVLAASRDYLLGFVREPARRRLLAGERRDLPADRKELTRLCLFPARFLYTAETGDAGSNDAAVAHYRARHGGPGAAIVALALALRNEPGRDPTPDERALVAAGLPGYYRDFLREFLGLLGGEPPVGDAGLPALLAAIERAPFGA
ncbi:MAG TPA: hypothetical protein VFW96_09940 [Thermomicrobiales bacterium]|nr:hypothetical protein [Thermomicrobiales bacterium]